MSVLIILVPLATLMAIGALVAFVWGARRGQLDDLVSPAIRMLADETPPVAKKQSGERGQPLR